LLGAGVSLWCLPCGIVALCLAVFGASPALAQTHPTVPSYSSSPGATYNVYLDFGGFTYNGNWGTSGKGPGVTPAYDTNGDPTTFSSTELANIQNIWARMG
jgi:hypothetical protein